MENLIYRRAQRKAGPKESTLFNPRQLHIQDKGLAGNGTGKKIITTAANVIEDLALEANHLFDYSRGLDAKTRDIEQNRLKNPIWNNSGLFQYMNSMTTTPPPQKQAGLLDPNALKFIALLSVVGFVFYKFLRNEQDTPESPKSIVNHSKPIK